VNFLREIPGDSPVHRLWAGTKILAILGLSITLSYFPTWGSCAVATALIAVAVWSARIPAGAWPRLPRWFWIVTLITALLSGLAGGSPHLRIGGVDLGLGGIDAFGKFMAVGVLLLVAAAVLGWTTPLAEVAPAVATLLRPLGLLRVPVDEAATVVALSIRSLPLLMNEMRSLLAARRLRPRPESTGRGALEMWLDELVDLMVAAMAVAVRRAGELAEAITARGGTGRIVAVRRRPGWRDAAALSIVSAACLGASFLP
jgi:energy-coupling factor transporter transmembrane protein EcfT